MSVTGQHWQRPPRAGACPWWCGRGHYCTAQFGGGPGEHRSEPITCPTPYGAIIVTRAARPGRPSRLEVRATVGLDPAEDLAAHQTDRMVTGIDQAIRAAVGRALRSPQPGAAHRGSQVARRATVRALPID